MRRPLPLARLLACLVLTGAALPAACKSSNVYETDNARPNAIDFSKKISNPFLRDKVDVTSVYVGNTPDGLLRVQPNITNRTNAIAYYMYRFTWFDGQGLKIPANADFWTRREMNAGAVEEITAVAPTRSAVDWRMEIRPWDR